jgi:hypothetical protein
MIFLVLERGVRTDFEHENKLDLACCRSVLSLKLF